MLLSIQSRRKLRAKRTLSIRILLKIGQSKPNIVFESDRKKMMASLERNPERHGRRRRIRNRPTIRIQSSTFALAMIVIGRARKQGTGRPPRGLNPADRTRWKMTEITNEKDGSQLVLIPEGEFLMGSDEGYPSERPAHRVYVGAFYIGKNLVTNSQYRRFVLEI